MNLFEIRKSAWQLSENDFGIAAVHQADVVPFKRVNEALSHAVRVRAAHWRMDWLNSQRAPERAFHGRDTRRNCRSRTRASSTQRGPAKARLDCFHQHVAYRFAWKTSFGPSAPYNAIVHAAADRSFRRLRQQ
jgi:hypothetical protein